MTLSDAQREGLAAPGAFQLRVVSGLCGYPRGKSAMVAYGAGLKAEGRLLAVESLRPDELAVRISSPEGKIQLRDGPFAEAKEMVGGFFLIEAANRDEAVTIASRCPAARFATVEVRECGPCHDR